jgi:hypothetical protein
VLRLCFFFFSFFFLFPPPFSRGSLPHQ